MPDDLELLERESEQAALVALVAAACQGAGRVAMVEGAAGIGKTRLLAAARDEAERAGMRVLAARGMELEREFAYGVVRQMFDPVLAGVSEAERAELLSGAAGQAAVLFGQPNLGAGAGDASFAIVHGLFWLVVNLCAQRPVMLCVDDVHWSDTASLRFLAYLILRLEGLGLLVLAALRPAEPSADPHLLAQIVIDPLVRLVRLTPLSPAGSARLVRAVLGGQVEEEFCAACHDATGGNPLWLRELASVAAAEGLEPTATGAAHLIELGPRAVGRRVALRLARLGPAAEAVCGAVAVLGDGAEPAQVAALAGREFTEAAEAMRQLVEVGMLYRRGQKLGFVHPLVRAAVYEGLSETERLAGHTHAARLLDEGGAAAEQVAAHLLLVPPAEDWCTVSLLRRAADEAVTRGSPDSAVAYLERCLQEPLRPAERVDVLVQLGAAAQLIDMAKTAEHLHAALALIEQPEHHDRIADMLGRALNSLGRYDEAAQVYLQAIQALGEEHTDSRRRLEAGLLGVAIADPALAGLAVQRIDKLRDEPGDAGPGSRMLDTTIALYDALAGAPAQATVPRARRGLIGEVLIEQGNAAEALVYGCTVLMAADLKEVMAFYDAWLAQAYQRGSVIAVGAAKCFRALAWLWRGYLAEAEANARDALEAFATTRPDISRLFAVPFLTDALMEQGQLAEAEAALTWVSVSTLLSRAGHWYWVLDSRARLLMLQGRTEEGLETMLACGRRFMAHGGQNPAMIAWRSSAALALLTLGRRGEARALAAEELDLAQRWGAPRALGRALRVAGLVEGGEEGLVLLQEAVDVLAPSPARLEYAKALVDFGTALQCAGRRVECRKYLRQGIEQAQLCGAAPLSERGWEGLRASGARPRRVALSGAAALTPSERRVAALAAAGRSNRDIAQALFITVNTVEMHLTKAYRKLGISSRDGLGQALSTPPAGYASEPHHI
jgi:DNA-binding CsgD family transcriptional regulator/predicted negative regulator of RcsB-dependent stress response